MALGLCVLLRRRCPWPRTMCPGCEESLPTALGLRALAVRSRCPRPEDYIRDLVMSRCPWP